VGGRCSWVQLGERESRDPLRSRAEKRWHRNYGSARLGAGLERPGEREAPVYTDYRQKHITVPGLRPGEVLEYNVATVIHTPLAPGQFWTEYDFDKNNIHAR